MKRAEKERYLQEKLQQMLQLERQLWAEGRRFLAGVDEVGRGPLAGPVVAAAVVLPQDFSLLGVDDSKKLTEKKREALFDELTKTAVAVGYGVIDNRIIDEINILEATKLAMRQAVGQAAAQLSAAAGAALDHVLIDALTLADLPCPQTGIIRGDEKSASIAAASILAKVTRDRLMRRLHETWPEYAFDRNKGYGTRQHYEGVRRAGLCPIHRRTFFSNLPADARVKPD